MTSRAVRALAVLCCGVLVTTTGCAFHGLNSLPLPGAVGRGAGAATYHVEIANVATMEPNSPVLINDVVVGSVSKMTFINWHAMVDVSITPDVVVPANAVARIGQTSLLGSLHLSMDPPLGQAPSGRLQPGATLPLDASSTYPSTESTLSSLSAVINGGGLGQIGDIIHNASTALSGREGDIRELLTRLDNFVTTIDAQRPNIIAAIDNLNRLAGTFANQTEAIDQALKRIPPALDVLIRERPRLTTALDKLRVFSATATGAINDTQADLVANLKNLEPTIQALADVGPDIDQALSYATVYPFGQDLIDRGLHGDYMNLYAIIDLTYPRLKRSLLLGTRWGDENAKLIPAPGEPYFLRYNLDPIGAPLAVAAPPAATGSLPETAQVPMPAVNESLLPVAPPALAAQRAPVAPPAGGTAPIFAGPYGPPAPDSARAEQGGN